MKTIKLRNSLSLIAFMVICGLSYSQNLVVTLSNSNTETFPFSIIQSIKFGTTSMIVYEMDGTINTWEIDNIDNYKFESSASISEQNLDIKEVLSIFPNASSDLVNIQFVASKNGSITIDILDVTGKLLQQIYSGAHQGEKQYQWQAKAAGNIFAGTYFCRIVSENKTIIKPIIIQ